jgi:ceramide glucosyltransferase
VLNEATNPKIEALSEMEEHASGALYWVTDSNVRVETDTLKKLVHEHIVNKSKVVFSPIRGTGSKTFGSILENAYLNFFVSGSIIWAWRYMKQHLIVGKSMLVEKEALLTFGGFGHFKDYLAEDFVMGDIYSEKGIYISSNFTWVTNYISKDSVKNFWDRVQRWSKLRYHIKRTIYVIEILGNPIAISLIGLIYLGAGWLNVVVAAAALKILLEYINFFAVNTEDRKKIWIIAIYPLAVIIKDILLFFIYLIPYFSSNVSWHGYKMKITQNSRIIRLNVK